jgi:plastocyanin
VQTVPVPEVMEPPMRRMLAFALLALCILPVSAFAATAPVPIKLAGTFFNNKPHAKLTIKLGQSVRFVWKNGFHNIVTQTAPAGAKKVNSGNPVSSHKPILFKPAKKGKYVFYCVPHKALGMILTLIVK